MEERLSKEILRITLAIAGVLLAGTAGYMLIEGWNALDGFYMTVITLATIGYGETHPLSFNGRIFTLFLIFGGIGLMTYAFSSLTAFVVGGHITDAFRRKKMENKIRALSGHFIVCGASHTAMNIMDELSKTGREFVVIEQDPVEFKRLADSGHLAALGDAAEDDVLIKAGVKSARGIFCALENDKDNAFIALTAKGINPSLRIISMQTGENVKDKLLRSGVDAVVNSGFIGGLRMASEMLRPATVGFLDWMLRGATGKDFRFEDIKISKNSQMKGRHLGDIKGSKGDSALVVAIKLQDTGDYEINPSPERPLHEDEVLVALGSRQQIKDLKQIIG